MKQRTVAKLTDSLPKASEAQKAARDNAYREINTVAFKRNYKMLLGHFSLKTRETARL